jgi:hypothetical protein
MIEPIDIIMTVGAQGDHDIGGYRQPNLVRFEDGDLAGDQAAFQQALDAARTLRGREMHLVRQLLVGLAAISLQGREELEVEAVEGDFLPLVDKI